MYGFILRMIRKSHYLLQFSRTLLVNPLVPRSDERVTSSYDIHSFSGKRFMRILKLIRKKFLA